MELMFKLLNSILFTLGSLSSRTSDKEVRGVVDGPTVEFIC